MPPKGENQAGCGLIKMKVYRSVHISSAAAVWDVAWASRGVSAADNSPRCNDQYINFNAVQLVFDVDAVQLVHDVASCTKYRPLLKGLGCCRCSPARVDQA